MTLRPVARHEVVGGGSAWARVQDGDEKGPYTRHDSRRQWRKLQRLLPAEMSTVPEQQVYYPGALAVRDTKVRTITRLTLDRRDVVFLLTVSDPMQVTGPGLQHRQSTEVGKRCKYILKIIRNPILRRQLKKRRVAIKAGKNDWLQDSWCESETLHAFYICGGSVFAPIISATQGNQAP
jgi:hypothetical protein